MADTTTVVEGKVKYRDGRKWKQRWCVLKKPSPVADRLQVLLYKDVREAIRDGCKPKSCFPIESFYGLQSGFTYEKENNIMAIICQKQVTLFSFENREDLIQFEIKIRRSLGEEHQFPVRVVKMPSHGKLPQDLIRMHIQGQKFCLTANVPPKVLQTWHISDLRRFGNVEGKFLFEGGSRCNKGAGLHALMSEQIEDIGEIIRLAAMGRTSSCLRMDNKRDGLASHISSYEQALLQYNRIVVSVEDLRERLERDNDVASLSSNEYLDTYSSSLDNHDTCSPAKTVLRPRSGKEYKVVERRTTLSEFSSSPSSPTTPTTPNSPVSVFTFDIHEPGASNVEGTGTIRSPASRISKNMKSDDSAPSSPWMPIPKKCLKKQLSSSRLHRDSARTRNDSVSNSDSATKERHSSVSNNRSDSISHKNSVSRKRSDSSCRTSKRRSSSARSKHGDGKSHARRTTLPQPDSDSELDSINLSIHGGRCDSVSYHKDMSSGAALRLVECGGGKGDSVYLQLWDTKAGKSNSPKASVDSNPSPPISPKHILLQPLAPIDDDEQEELNYAEMDLGPSTLSSPLPKKPVPKFQSNSIEYTRIDMLATEALKEAGKEHAQGRTDSLRRSRSVKYTTQLTHHTSLKERKGSTSSARDRKYSASAVEFSA